MFARPFDFEGTLWRIRMEKKIKEEKEERLRQLIREELERFFTKRQADSASDAIPK